MYSALGCSILIDFSILGYFCQLEFIHPSDIAICSIGGSRHSFDCKAITLSNRIRSVIGCRFEHTSRVDRIATRHRRNKQQYRPQLFPVEVSYLPDKRTDGLADRRAGGRTDGRPGGLVDGTDERTDGLSGRTAGRQGGLLDGTDKRTDGPTDRRAGRRTEGRPGGRTDGTDERTDGLRGRTAGRADLWADGPTG